MAFIIRGSNGFGCTDIQPINVHLSDGPVVTVNPPAPVCYPATVDLTKVFTTNEAGVNFIYYTDPVAKTPITNYQAVAASGLYYAQATGTITGLTCSSIKSADVTINPLPPVMTDDNFGGCPPVNLSAYTRPGPESTLKYNFFSDAQGLQPVPDPTNITTGGTYYFKALNESGCESNIAQLNVTVFPAAAFTVTDPAPVVRPQVVNLADTYLPAAGLTFTYWKDMAANQPLSNYQSIGESGTYYIKAVNTNDCSVINPVHVVVNEPPGANIVFKNTFSPNGDGINDKFTFTVTGTAQINYFKIYNRYGQKVFETTETANQWDGTNNGKPLPTGTYYWVFSCYDTYYKKSITKSGSVTIIR